MNAMLGFFHGAVEEKGASILLDEDVERSSGDVENPPAEVPLRLLVCDNRQMNSSQPPNSSEVRADVWLWAARFFKTRALAKQAIEGGKVELNEMPCKPAKSVHPGDLLKLTRGDERLVCEVLGVSTRRGPASEAQSLYRETDASQKARAQQRELRRLQGSAFSHPAKRPDKKARRQLIGLKSQE